jgi:hypothetical protein
MLPGLRILFAITLLSVSVLIFGLGAAAYLRSAHDDFASAPWRPIETPATARVDLAPATLALLRVDVENAPALPVAAASPVVVAPVETKLPDAPPSATADASPPVIAPPSSEPAATTKPPTLEAALSPAQEVTVPTPAPVREASVALPAAETQVPEVKATEAKAAEAKPADAKPAEAERTEAKASEIKSSEIKSSEIKASEIKAAENRPAETIEPTPAPAPTVVAALNADKTETPATNTPEVAQVAATQPVTEAQAAVATAPPPAPGADTLKADDKAIEAASPTKVAALADPTVAATPALPSKEVKIPNPRLDPAVIEAQRKRIVAQQRARARAAQARRAAAARARAAAQAKAAAANNPFGTPRNTAGTTTN